MKVYGIEYAKHEDKTRYFKFICPFLSTRVEIDGNEYEELCLTFRSYHINNSRSVIRVK